MHLFNIENLVLRARSEFNGFAGASANRFGVLESSHFGLEISDFGLQLTKLK